MNHKNELLKSLWVHVRRRQRPGSPEGFGRRIGCPACRNHAMSMWSPKFSQKGSDEGGREPGPFCFVLVSGFR